MIRPPIALALLLTLPLGADEIVLKNGNVLRGDIRREGDMLYVRVEQGRVGVHVREVRELRAQEGPAPAAPGLRDPEISVAVARAIREDPAVQGRQVAVDVQKGRVTLRGTVDSAEERERAAYLARAVAGVREVDVKLDVVRRPDAEILEDLRGAWGNDIVSVTDGTVWARTRAAADAARGVRGVREARVSPSLPPKSDAEILGEIEKLIRWDVHVDGDRLKVEVRGGKATLTGVVSSAAEKEQAARLALLGGAGRVDASGLAVEGWRREPAFRGNKFSTAQDEDIEREVDRRLRLHDVLKARVDVVDGRATLEGEVATLSLKRKTENAARRVAGVREVHNQIHVRPEIPLSDADIAARVRALYEMDPRLDPLELDVGVTEGVARLTGRVPGAYERARADALASRVMGVLAVENLLEVEPGGLPWNPDPDGWDVEDFVNDGPPAPTSWRNDDELRQVVEWRLFWSPFVNEDQVKVEVENGEVRLSGRVDSYVDAAAAEREARRAGAVAVVNAIQVR